MHKKDFSFSDGAVVKVHEISSADLDMFQELSADASQATFTDSALAILARLYYPVLAACTDNPPSLEASYKVEPCDLDNWFALCCDLNQDWLGKLKYTETPIKLNGKSITVKSRRPSVEMRLAKLQDEAKQAKPLTNPKDEEYRLNGYIGVAAASTGNIPSAEQARHELSLKDFNLWHRTVRELIPEWYQNATVDTVDETQTTEKKTEGTAESAAGSLEVSVGVGAPEAV